MKKKEIYTSSIETNEEALYVYVNIMYEDI